MDPLHINSLSSCSGGSSGDELPTGSHPNQDKRLPHQQVRVSFLRRSSQRKDEALPAYAGNVQVQVILFQHFSGSRRDVVGVAFLRTHKRNGISTFKALCMPEQRNRKLSDSQSDSVTLFPDVLIFQRLAAK